MLGLSFGGNLVFELTKRLEEAGETVAFAGGIDNPVDLKMLMDKREAGRRQFVIDLLYFHSVLSYEAAMEFEESLRSVRQLSGSRDRRSGPVPCSLRFTLT